MDSYFFYMTKREGLLPAISKETGCRAAIYLINPLPESTEQRGLMNHYKLYFQTYVTAANSPIKQLHHPVLYTHTHQCSAVYVGYCVAKAGMVQTACLATFAFVKTVC